MNFQSLYIQIGLIGLLVLAAIARLLSNEEARNRLHGARDKYEAMSVIQKYSRE